MSGWYRKNGASNEADLIVDSYNLRYYIRFTLKIGQISVMSSLCRIYENEFDLFLSEESKKIIDYDVIELRAKAFKRERKKESLREKAFYIVKFITFTTYVFKNLL